MPEKIFTDPQHEPTPAELQECLAGAYPHFLALQEAVSDFTREFYFAGKGTGWGFKAHRKGKVLIWVFPYPGYFLAAFALREEDKELILASGLAEEHKQALQGARAYREGYPLRIPVHTGEDLAQVLLVIEGLRVLR